MQASPLAWALHYAKEVFQESRTVKCTCKRDRTELGSDFTSAMGKLPSCCLISPCASRKKSSPYRYEIRKALLELAIVAHHGHYRIDAPRHTGRVKKGQELVWSLSSKPPLGGAAHGLQHGLAAKEERPQLQPWVGLPPVAREKGFLCHWECLPTVLRPERSRDGAAPLGYPDFWVRHRDPIRFSSDLASDWGFLAPLGGGAENPPPRQVM